MAGEMEDSGIKNNYKAPRRKAASAILTGCWRKYAPDLDFFCKLLTVKHVVNYKEIFLLFTPSFFAISAL